MSAQGDELDKFLERLHDEREWDFRHYKKTSISRRITMRLNSCNVSSFDEYGSVLQSDPSEYDRLFSTLTIKVTEFFREPEVFEILSKILPEKFKDDIELRAWSCGCAYGNEAYSLAITIAESLGLKKLWTAKIFATDIDPGAVNAGRRGVYTEEDVQGVKDALRTKYFFWTLGGCKLRYEIRNSLRFGFLNIVKDPPISKIDILFCRNLLIYFEKDLQKRVFEKFDYALKPGGLLVLGRSETMPVSFAQRYVEVEKKSHIYIKKGSE